MDFEVNLRRLEKVVARITRGLYWHHHGHRRLPDGSAVVAWAEDALRGISDIDRAELRTTVIEPCLNCGEHTLGRGVLRYWYAPSESEHLTAWVFEFFGDVRFVALTSPDSLPPKA